LAREACRTWIQDRRTEASVAAITANRGQALFRKTLRGVVLLLPLTGAAASLSPLWSASFPEGSDVLYAATLDAAARADGGSLLFYADPQQRLHRVDLAGNDVGVPWTPFPTAGTGDVRFVSVAETRDGRWRAVILPNTREGTEEDIHAGVGRYDHLGRMACMYESVFDDGVFGADGDLLVAASEDALQFFGSDCELRALVPEPHLKARFTAAVAPDDSLVVFHRVGALAARTATGELAWVHCLARDETFQFADPLLVSRSGRVTAFQSRDAWSRERRRAVVLNEAGVAVRRLTQPIGMIDAISADGSRLLATRVTSAWLIDLTTGASLFETLPQPFMNVGEAALSASAKTVALLYVLAPEVPAYSERAYPQQYLLAIHRASASPIFWAFIPRIDDRIASSPPAEPGSLLLADDGAYALVAFPRHLAVFALGAE
jgi:hypothetical protein